MEQRPIYKLRAIEAFEALETTPEGLHPDEVTRRRGLYGPNILTEEMRTSRRRLFFAQIKHPLALLLWLAALAAFLVGQPGFGLVVIALILANAGFSFWREYRAEQAMQALRELLPSYALVVRRVNGHGQQVQIPSDEIVPGDILVLAEGGNIPADARVVEEYGLRTNNATLTGEAVPARKSADASLREGISELERPNLVFAGTTVFSGTGRAVVYATGMLTQFGRIAHLTQVVREQPSPLHQELARLIHRISLVVLGLGVIVFVVGAFDVGLDYYEAFLLAMGILVAALPEGLPATLTLSLAMAGQRLAQRGVLVKKLSVIETLGTISTICTDKSGTLTQNQMTVREIWVGGERLTVSGVGYEPKGEFSRQPTVFSRQPTASSQQGSAFSQQPTTASFQRTIARADGDLEALLIAGALCNNARLTPPTPDHPIWSTLGDQTEAALRVAALKGGLDEQRLEQRYPRIHELPFDARRKRMSTIHENRRQGDRATSQSGDQAPQLPGTPAPPPSGTIAFVKGAPREVLQLCTHILLGDQVQPLDEAQRAEILAANDDYARRALRVLALAQRPLPPRSGFYSAESVERELTFLGLAAMHDPPRPEVAEAVGTCLGAGIRMMMVTGDYGLTAESLARRVGMLSEPNPLILTGADLDEMDDLELQGVLNREIVFARMAPEHKLRLVAALQELGEVVAVTGDGVNDAPALRKADVGVAMGVTGTDVAKEASDIVLTTDNFATLVNGIEEGRAVYDNIRKFLTYIFSSNVPEVLPFMVTAAFGFPLALTVPQILAIDLGTDMLPAVALGSEKPEPDVMRRPPRRRDQPLVDRGLLWRAFLWLGLIEAALCYLGFFLVFYISGAAEPGGLVAWLLSYLPAGFVGALQIPPNLAYMTAITVFHAGVVMAQVGNAFACRTETNRGRTLGWGSNRLLIYGVIVEILIILALIYVPFLAKIFNHVPLQPGIWLWLSTYGLILYSLDWIRKGVVRGWRRMENGRQGDKANGQLVD